MRWTVLYVWRTSRGRSSPGYHAPFPAQREFSRRVDAIVAMLRAFVLPPPLPACARGICPVNAAREVRTRVEAAITLLVAISEQGEERTKSCGLC